MIRLKIALSARTPLRPMNVSELERSERFRKARFECRDFVGEIGGSGGEPESEFGAAVAFWPPFFGSLCSGKFKKEGKFK